MAKNKYKISYNNFFGLSPKRCGSFFLFQVGEALCVEDTIIEEHKQHYFEITYAYEGKGLSYVNEHAETLEKGDCFLSFPNETHTIKSDEHDPLRFIYLSFFAKEKSHGNTLMKWIYKNCKENTDRKYRVKNLQSLLLNLLNEVRNEDNYSPRVMGFLLEQILVECCRTISKNDTLSAPFQPSDKAILTHDIISYIDENVASIQTLSDLESVFFYDVRYLSKCFLSQAGISLGQYFLSRKMETAKKWLQDGKTSTQVSDELGYSSIHAFSRAYKKYFGRTPSQDRKKE